MNTIIRSFLNEDLVKAIKLPDGSKRKFGPNWYIKQGGKWEYIPKGKKGEGSKAVNDARKMLSDAYSRFGDDVFSHGDVWYLTDDGIINRKELNKKFRLKELDMSGLRGDLHSHLGSRYSEGVSAQSFSWGVAKGGMPDVDIFLKYSHYPYTMAVIMDDSGTMDLLVRRPDTINDTKYVRGVAREINKNMDSLMEHFNTDEAGIYKIMLKKVAKALKFDFVQDVQPGQVDLQKAHKTGYYINNRKNRLLGQVGQKYSKDHFDPHEQMEDARIWAEGLVRDKLGIDLDYSVNFGSSSSTMDNDITLRWKDPYHSKNPKEFKNLFLHELAHVIDNTQGEGHYSKFSGEYLTKPMHREKEFMDIPLETAPGAYAASDKDEDFVESVVHALTGRFEDLTGDRQRFLIDKFPKLIEMQEIDEFLYDMGANHVVGFRQMDKSPFVAFYKNAPKEFRDKQFFTMAVADMANNLPHDIFKHVANTKIHMLGEGFYSEHGYWVGAYDDDMDEMHINKDVFSEMMGDHMSADQYRRVMIHEFGHKLYRTDKVPTETLMKLWQTDERVTRQANEDPEENFCESFAAYLMAASTEGEHEDNYDMNEFKEDYPKTAEIIGNLIKSWK